MTAKIISPKYHLLEKLETCYSYNETVNVSLYTPFLFKKLLIDNNISTALNFHREFNDTRFNDVKNLLKDFIESLDENDTYGLIWVKFKRKILNKLLSIENKTPIKIADDLERAMCCFSFLLMNSDYFSSNLD